MKVDPAAAYLHVTSNETIHGLEYEVDPARPFPDPGKVPLIADMSSDFLWRPLDVARFGLIYAGAQKNIGPSGIVVVVVSQGAHRGGAEGHPQDLPVPHGRREQVALQHAAHLRHLPGAQRARRG